MNEPIRNEIKHTIEKSINNFFKNKEVNVTHILDKLFPVERRIRSLIGGLETSMGTTVWEPIAKKLAESNGFTVLNSKEFLMPKVLPDNVVKLKANWMQKRADRTNSVKLSEFVQELRTVLNGLNPDDLHNMPLVKPTAGKGIDIWLRKNDKEFIYDIKTNQINQKDGLAFDSSLMDWYIYRISQNPDLEVSAQLAFPFNPFKPKDWWAKQGSRAYPLQKGLDAVVEDEFWDFLSGQSNTYSEIELIFEELKAENFSSKFHDILYKNS